MITDFEYIFRRICERRGGKLSKVESVAFNTLISSGLPTNTALLPAAANVFYYIDFLVVSLVGAAPTGIPQIQFTNNGPGSAGTLLAAINAHINGFEGIDTDSLLYVVNTHSAGSVMLSGLVFKITYS